MTAARFVPPLLAAAAFVAVCVQLDPGGADPGMPQGPGLTVDEGFYSQQGVYLWTAVRSYHLALLHPASLAEVFDPAGAYLPDHPPLGKLWLGAWHDLAWWAHAPESPGGPVSVARARVGSAAAFALTVGLLAWCGARWFGAVAGVSAGVLLCLTPRVWGHAHLASLETVTNLFFTLAVCGVAAWWDPRVVNFKRPAWCGVLLGLVLLCKVQGALLGPAVAAWAAYHAGRAHGWRHAWRAVGPAACFGGVGLMVFALGWPYLWTDLENHPAAFLATVTERAPVRNFYLGRVWNGDGRPDTPWHYPLVMTAATVPVGVSLLAAAGLWLGGKGERNDGEKPSRLPADPRFTLFAFAFAVPLGLVCTRGPSLYDGVRLWLVVFPPLAVLAGVGAQHLYDRLREWRPKWAGPVVAAVVLIQGVNVVWMSPVWLSSYSCAVGGLWGADKLGFERNYWGDAVTRDLLDAADAASHPNAPLFVAPALHQFADLDRAAASPAVRRRNAGWEGLSTSGRARGLGSDTAYGLELGYHESSGFGTTRFTRLAWWRAMEEPHASSYVMLLIDRPARFLPSNRVVRRQGVVLAVAPTDFPIPEPTEEEWATTRGEPATLREPAP